jgi:hypothetical protein
LTFTHELNVDPTISQQLHRLVTTQIIIAVALVLVALAVLGVAVAAFTALRRATGLLERITDKTEDLTDSVKDRMNDVLETVDDVNAKLRLGAQAVEQRVRQFGTVVDVVQSEAEDLLLDAASTAHGVHAASEMLRSGKRDALTKLSDDEDEEDVFTD